MSERSEIGWWYGRRLEDLTREELYGVIRWQFEEHQRRSEEHRRDLDMLLPPRPVGTAPGFWRRPVPLPVWNAPEIVGYALTPVLRCGCRTSCAEPGHLEIWRRP